MGAHFLFDEMLPGVKPEANNQENTMRQVEVFRHADKLYLRVGEINERDSGINRYTVELKADMARELIDAIEAGVGSL